MFCQYKDSLGIPETGFHTHYMGIAIMDVVATLVLTEMVVYFFNTPRLLTLGALLITGVVLHRLFCVRTVVDKYLFP